MTGTQIAVGFAVILFGWLFIRTNAANSRIDAVRTELEEKIKDTHEERESLRLEYVDKIKHLHDLIREATGQINTCKTEIDKEVKDNMTVVQKLLDRQMPKTDIKEYVNTKVEPFKRLEEALEKLDDKVNDVLSKVQVLLDRDSNGKSH